MNRTTKIKNIIGEERASLFLQTRGGKLLLKAVYQRAKYITERKNGRSPYIQHKANHAQGMDFLIYKELLRRKIKPTQKRFLFVWDTTEKQRNKKFFHKDCTAQNTRNFNLNYTDLYKKTLALTSAKFGFGKYLVTTETELYDEYPKIFKGNNHATKIQTEKRKANLSIGSDDQDITIQYYLEQPNPTHPDKKDEINIYVVRDIKKDVFYFYGLLITYKKTVVNRKKVQIEQNPQPIKQILSSDEIQNMENYLREIHFDYGRIEMIRDSQRGLCIIDINNSPGGGPLTDANYQSIADIFQKIMTH